MSQRLQRQERKKKKMHKTFTLHASPSRLKLHVQKNRNELKMSFFHSLGFGLPFFPFMLMKLDPLFHFFFPILQIFVRLLLRQISSSFSSSSRAGWRTGEGDGEEGWFMQQRRGLSHQPLFSTGLQSSITSAATTEASSFVLSLSLSKVMVHLPLSSSYPAPSTTSWKKKQWDQERGDDVPRPLCCTVVPSAPSSSSCVAKAALHSLSSFSSLTLLLLFGTVEPFACFQFFEGKSWIKKEEKKK